MSTEPGTKRQRKDVRSAVAVVLGGQWGDEGKGKLVDILAQDADVVCRCQVDRALAGKQFIGLSLWRARRAETTPGTR